MSTSALYISLAMCLYVEIEDKLRLGRCAEAISRATHAQEETFSNGTDL